MYVLLYNKEYNIAIICNEQEFYYWASKKKIQIISVTRIDNIFFIEFKNDENNNSVYQNLELYEELFSNKEVKINNNKDYTLQQGEMLKIADSYYNILYYDYYDYCNFIKMYEQLNNKQNTIIKYK